jgi:hypothetical protein
MALPLPVAGAYPQYSSDHVSKYTPKLYAAKLLEKFYDVTVFGEISMNTYEGTIKTQGDTVIIRTRPDITISDYTRNMNLDTIRQHPEPTAIELVIDKAKVYSVGVDIIDEKQFDISALDEWATDASSAMGLTIDADILANIYTQCNASNTGLTAGYKSGAYNLGTSGSPRVVTKADVLDLLPDCSSTLAEYAVPRDSDRWIVFPEIIGNRIKKSDLRNVSFAGDSATSTLRNGRIGELDGFKIYLSNSLVPITGSGSTAVWPVIFGHRGALTFASQLIENRKISPTNTFAKYLEGLQVYGYKVVQPKYMGYAAVQVG